MLDCTEYNIPSLYLMYFKRFVINFSYAAFLIKFWSRLYLPSPHILPLILQQALYKPVLHHYEIITIYTCMYVQIVIEIASPS